jgi:hypothetical protein
MLEWKSRVVILLVFAVVVAALLGDIGAFHNHGW